MIINVHYNHRRLVERISEVWSRDVVIVDIGRRRRIEITRFLSSELNV